MLARRRALCNSRQHLKRPRCKENGTTTPVSQVQPPRRNTCALVTRAFRRRLRAAGRARRCHAAGRRCAVFFPLIDPEPSGYYAGCRGRARAKGDYDGAPVTRFGPLRVPRGFFCRISAHLAACTVGRTLIYGAVVRAGQIGRVTRFSRCRCTMALRARNTGFNLLGGILFLPDPVNRQSSSKLC